VDCVYRSAELKAEWYDRKRWVEGVDDETGGDAPPDTTDDGRIRDHLEEDRPAMRARDCA